MQVSKLSTTSLIALVVFLSLLMSGCIGNEKIPTRYYLIDPIETPALNFSSDHPLAIEIIDVHLPQYLERFHIATRAGENRLKFSESNQWGENLRKNLMRTLSRNLSKLLSTQDIGTPLRRTSSRPDYRVQVYIEQFEQDVDRKVKLSARWQVSKGDSLVPLGIFSKEIMGSTLDEGDYDQMVATMGQLYSDLSRDIAESVIAEENK